MRNRTIVYCLTILLIRMQSFGQTDESGSKSSAEYWLDYNMKSVINEDGSVSGFIGYRTISPRTYGRLVIVPTYNMRHKKVRSL